MSTSKDKDWCQQRFMRVSSEEEIRRHFDFVPDNQEFLIKLRSPEGATLVNFSYILKKESLCLTLFNYWVRFFFYFDFLLYKTI